MDKDYTTVKNFLKIGRAMKFKTLLTMKVLQLKRTIQLISTLKDRDLVLASDSLIKETPRLLQRAMEPESQAPDTVTVEEYKEMNEYQFEF